MSIVREMLNREDLPESQVSSQRHGVAVGEAPAGLLKACSRLMELLDIPTTIPFLSHLIQREIIYRVLRTPQGARLRTIANKPATSQQNGKSDFLAARQLYEAFAYGGAGRDLANGSFDTSPSVPRIDAMSPLQYQKLLRLQRARERMLMDELMPQARRTSRLRKCESIQS